MNEIKFKGKRSDNGEWVYRDLLNCCDGGTKKIAVVNDEDFFEVDPETVAQFVGKRDKNGNEVFTDHILKYTETIFTDCSETEISEVRDPALMRIVTYRPLASVIVPLSDGVRAFGIDQETGEKLILGDIRSEDIEIVGSIHDNQELLEGSL